MISFNVTIPFLLNEEMRQILGTVTQVPIFLFNILSSIGKIEGSITWHSYSDLSRSDNREHAALYLYLIIFVVR